MQEYIILTFDSTSFAIQAEAQFKTHTINFKTIPVPREISTSCGLAIRFEVEDLETVEAELIKTSKITISGIYSFIKDENGNKTIERIK